MSVGVPEPLGWVRAFDVGGALDGIDPHPGRSTFEIRLGRGLARSWAEGGGDAFDEAGEIRPRFFYEWARAILANDREDARLIEGKGAADWAALLATPAQGRQRIRSLLRVGGLLLSRDVPEE